MLKCRKRGDKRHRLEDLGFEHLLIPADRVVLVKTFQIGYVKKIADSRQLQAKQSAWQPLLQAVGLADIQLA